MIQSALSAWKAASPPTAFLIAYGFQLALYLGWGGYIAVGNWLLRVKVGTGAILDARLLHPSRLRHEIVRGIASCVVVALVTTACIQRADSVVPSSAWRLGLEMASLILFYDVVFYLFHRLLHSRALRAIHGVHHHSVRPAPWSGLSVHPVEAFLLEAPILMFVFVMPVSMATLVLFQIFIQYFSAVGHSNFDPFARLSSWGWLKSLMRMHQLHHARGNVNFSTFSPLLDWIFKTHAV